MTNDPGRLAHNLSTVSKEVTDWSYAVRGFKEDAAYEMRKGFGEINKAEHSGRITENHFANDEDLLKKASEEHNKLTDRCNEAAKLARQSLSSAKAALELSDKTRKYWEEELKAAEAWLARARERLAWARAELLRARANLDYALSSLRSAERSLSACMHNDERRNCNSEGAAVQQARAMVYAAEAEVRAAEAEVRAAEAEVAQAEAKVRACTKAVEFAKEAVKLAEKTVLTAQYAVNYAERSLEYVEAARKALIEAQKALDAEEEAVESMKAALREARFCIEEAHQHHKNAERFEDSTQWIAKNTTNQLDEKVEQLWKLDRPDLFEAFKIAGTAFAMGTAVWMNPHNNTIGSRMFDQVVNDNIFIQQDAHQKADPLLPFKQTEIIAHEIDETLKKREEMLDQIRKQPE